ncbi:anthranilate phosphoribosyltransferase [Alienimonas californiensis]|uniref:Anthranilate phosphoribosyltransferase n=1 Tax=Alienimonas californiensis TaxID=2527989 RepID=A0A517PEI3_9PLAN|nr:anthranilate phosphoribosyltransferase [Alienimonas californiensis]QDT17783.1 Anthranilate phosphoribosyltransferase [Alienimonas californiensis]
MTAPATNRPSNPVRRALSLALQGRDVPVDRMREAVEAVMDDAADPHALAGLLIALRMKGEVAGELVGAATAMRRRMTPVPVPPAADGSPDPLLDTCGTGGDGLHTFNISTAAALVTAACGVRVAKHGNRSVSSNSGSADVLEALGVNVSLSPEQVGRCVREVGLGFAYAPASHGAMRHAAPVRKGLGVRTLFNLLGPLTNPAGAGHQLLGAASTQHAALLAEALHALGTRRSLVVCGNDELDEVSLWGETAVFVVTPEGVTRETWTAETLGLPGCTAADLRADGPKASAAVIRGVLNGDAGPARAIVVANAAAGLLAVGAESDPRAAAARAAAALDEGAAAAVLSRLAQWTNA